MVNRLGDAGLVERLEDIGDRRVKHLSLSERGRELLRSRQERRIDRMEGILAKLDEDQQLAVLHAIETLIAAGGDVSHTESLPFVAEIEQAVAPAPPYTR
jgi:DNA-binding MarR family transcriptional regulator